MPSPVPWCRSTAAWHCDLRLMTALPEGFGLALDRRLRRFGDGTVLAGGHPGRVVTLTPRGALALDGLVATGVADPATRELAGRLVDAGMAHPRHRDARPGPRPPSPSSYRPSDGPRPSTACLAALGDGHPVVVVDDGSPDPGPLAAVCAATVRPWCDGRSTVDRARPATRRWRTSGPTWWPSSTATARWPAAGWRD